MERQKIVSDAGFIDSVRELGITTRDAINEFIDNSFDAEATNIWITIDSRDDGRLFLIIEDDGKGIPPDYLDRVLAFGGRLSYDRKTTGKFGWGLTASACCQSPRTEIYSKTKETDKFFYGYLDLEELKTNGGLLPIPCERNPFESEFSDFLNLKRDTDSGTIIILTDLDRPERRRKDSLVKLLYENIAVVQRYFLYEGKNIYINGKKVKYNDPLMLMNDSENVELLGEKAEEYGRIKPIVYEDILDNEGNPVKVEIKIVKLPIEKLLSLSREERRKYPFNINTDNQGFYIIRNKRQIAGGQTLHLFSRHPQLNYFRGEISFSTELDDKFGIQTNKSRFSLSDDLREQIEKRVAKVISQLRKDISEETEKFRSIQKKELEGILPTEAEKIATRVSKRLKPSGYKPNKEEIESYRREREEKLSEVIKEIKEKRDIPESEKEKLIRNIQNAFQKQAEFRRIIDVIGTGEFYSVKHKGEVIEVIINRAHKFYKLIYERASQDKLLQIFLDLFLFTLAKAEDIFYENEEIRKFYEIQRREWSAIMSAFLEEAEEELGDELSKYHDT